MPKMMNISIKIPGAAALPRLLQLVDVTIKEDWELLWKGFIRRTPVPGMSTVVVERKWTLEGSTKDAFDNSGKNAYAEAWPGYDNEPKYAYVKQKLGGGTGILVWEKSKNPLRKAFMSGHPDHVEEVAEKRMIWGAKGKKGAIAARLSEGGFFQPWDKTTNIPARPIVRLSEDAGKEVARGMQRILRGRLGREGFRAARREPRRTKA